MTGLRSGQCAGLNDLPDIPPPRQNTPEAWIARARTCHDLATAAYRDYLHKTITNEALEIINKNDAAVQLQTIAKLSEFGKAVIHFCLKEAAEQGSLLGLTNQVLVNIGPPAVEPIVEAIPENGLSSVELGLFGVLSRMDVSPGNELSRLACSPGPLRYNAIRMLAKLKTDQTIATKNAGFNRKGAIDEKYRNLLLDQLNGEKSDFVKCNLVICQKYFSPPTDRAVNEIIAVSGTPLSVKTRTTAVQVLSCMLVSADTAQRNKIALVLAKLISEPNQQSLKIAAIEALQKLDGSVDTRVIKALQKCADGNSFALRQASLQTLMHMAIHNKECVQNISEALTEQDPVTVDLAKEALHAISPDERASVEADRRKKR